MGLLKRLVSPAGLWWQPWRLLPFSAFSTKPNSHPRNEPEAFVIEASLSGGTTCGCGCHLTVAGIPGSEVCFG
jgi:hypothetical protein